MDFGGGVLLLPSLCRHTTPLVATSGIGSLLFSPSLYGDGVPGPEGVGSNP